MSASVTILATRDLIAEHGRKIDCDEVAVGDGAVRFTRYRAEGGIVFGNPPVFGWVDQSTMLVPKEQFADQEAAPGVAGEALRVTLASSAAAGQLASACLLDDAWSRDFWHWTGEQLPKALLLEAAGFAGTYLVPASLPLAHQALELAGIAESRIAVCDQRLIAVGQLTYTPPLTQLDLQGWPALVDRIGAIRARLSATPPPRDPEVVFIHLGSPLFLKYACYQAISQGYDAVVVGDDSLRVVKHARFVHAAVHSVEASRFEQIYRHMSVNRYAPELVCFQRWFVLRDYMAKSGRSAILLDHDILAYAGLLELVRHVGDRAMLDLSWTNYLQSASALDGFCRFLWDCYADRSALEILARKYTLEGRPDGTPQLSDMVLLFEYAERRPDLVRTLRGSLGPAVGFDQNIRRADGFALAGNVKALEFVDGKPFCRRDDGSGLQQFHTLHFQGVAKPLMERLHTITDPRHLADLEPLDSAEFLRDGVPDTGAHGAH